MKKIVVAVACAAFVCGLNVLACGGMTNVQGVSLEVDCLYDNIELNEATLANAAEEVVCM